MTVDRSEFMDAVERGLMDYLDAIIPDQPPEATIKPVSWEYRLRHGTVVADYDHWSGTNDIRLATVTFNHSGFIASYPFRYIGVTGELKCNDLGRLAPFLIKVGVSDREWLLKCLDADCSTGWFDDHDATMLRLSL